MATKAIITDEDGQSWMVLTDDPAWPAVALLRKQHRSVIILPRATIMRQVSVNPETLMEKLGRLSVAVETTTDPETHNLVSEAFGRVVCLCDCLTVLWRARCDTIVTGRGT
jgi:riboflavin biosynthesis pyrimidine reductase